MLILQRFIGQRFNIGTSSLLATSLNLVRFAFARLILIWD